VREAPEAMLSRTNKEQKDTYAVRTPFDKGGELEREKDWRQRK
jgi:hypothetical protein